jgi:predicted mannosyl-3-phosphoglycerate phosphatase (HAD superfamily)
MPGFVQAIAFDLDGTLVTGDTVLPELVGAIDARRDAGVSVVLITGRIRSEFDQHFSGLAAHFDAVVYENGAVITVDDELVRVPPPVEPGLVNALRDKGIELRVGQSILAGRAADAAAIVDTIAALGLDNQVSHNRSELMVTPAGVSKGSGLRAVLSVLGVSVHNCIAVGDAENDLSMLQVAEIAVAVDNAVDSVRQHADLVLGAGNGAAVAQFLRGPVVSGASTVQSSRRALRIGQTRDGHPVTIPGAQANVLVSGSSGSGKSHLGRAAGRTLDHGRLHRPRHRPGRRPHRARAVAPGRGRRRLHPAPGRGAARPDGEGLPLRRARPVRAGRVAGGRVPAHRRRRRRGQPRADRPAALGDRRRGPRPGR